MAQKAEFDGNKAAYAAAVYTQTTDVETEVNGIMTYDREVVKFDETRLREAVQKLTSLYDTETVNANTTMWPVCASTRRCPD